MEMPGPAFLLLPFMLNPQLPSQIFTVDGRKHIGIYAKRRIEPGEELSYDYKFQEEQVSEMMCMVHRSAGYKQRNQF